ncbi:hypothetical protein K0T92_04730 [Paenibacillus oenotherae]|uniref:Uncharacterized protein n=1 Tax=Paenibacillus oenotherae TaxID=1435645 RepID=A0ABS7D4A7_9BACL|nr:hypothetical protein [Paenibacillus oenotherae]MBW7474038.1 hypothetical protein [Paenibacillus oenotherae]
MADQRNEDDKREGELTEDELEEVVGGLATVPVPLCKHCQQRIAVHDMSVCAACFLKLHGPITGPDVKHD